MNNKKVLSLTAAAILVLVAHTNAKALNSYVPRATIFHKVEDGDTLINLSERFLLDGSLYDELAIENNIEDPDFIRIGQIIRIPDKQILLGNVDDIDEYGCTPVDFNNPEDLNWKYYKMKEGDTFNGTYYKLYENIFIHHPEFANNTNHLELREALWLFNPYENAWKLPIGTKIYTADDYELYKITMELKSKNELIKTR